MGAQRVGQDLATKRQQKHLCIDCGEVASKEKFQI